MTPQPHLRNLRNLREKKTLRDIAHLWCFAYTWHQKCAYTLAADSRIMTQPHLRNLLNQREKNWAKRSTSQLHQHLVAVAAEDTGVLYPLICNITKCYILKHLHQQNVQEQLENL